MGSVRQPEAGKEVPGVGRVIQEIEIAIDPGGGRETRLTV